MSNEKITAALAEALGGPLFRAPNRIAAPQPLYDLNAAFAVASLMREKGWALCMESWIEHASWRACFYHAEESETAGFEHADDPSPGRAICIAALKALGLWREGE